MRLTKWMTIGLLALVAGCTAVSSRTNVNVGYYDVGGDSFSELDRQIALHGPQVPGVGKAIAATSVRMTPAIRFGNVGGQCRVTSAKVRVHANVTLPRFTRRRAADRKLKSALDNIESYARLHEAVHVSIADQFAEQAEQEISALPPVTDCQTMRERIAATYNKIMKEHESAQLAFDAQEQRRFARLRKDS
ncbi:DUF922 domain-containing protein [Salaquimonas pukyongi]|uniref:DUF922 domain-containing protein n=1 Tax=Salaquimonas pukyongi TaxID=2712698 RepID=UPI00096B8650|nr:DUF922 domain-containing protein [Salaquimonas pukyongi]